MKRETIDHHAGRRDESSSRTLRFRRGPMRGRRWWVLLGSVALAAAAAWFVQPQLDAWQTRSRARDALAALTRCLYGQASERTADRLRRTLLAAATGGSAQEDWPERCDRHALALQLAVGQLEQDRRGRCGGAECCVDDPLCVAQSQLRAALEAARPPLRRGRLEAEALERLLPLARAAGLEPSLGAVGSLPPEPARLHTPASMKPLHRRQAELLTDPPGSARLQLLLYDQRQRYTLCALELTQPTAARCRGLPHRLSGGPMGQLLASAAVAPPRLVTPGPAQGGPGWPHRLFDAETGRQLLALPHRPSGGYVWSDGSVAVLSTAVEADRHTLYRSPREPQAEPAPGRAIDVPDAATAGPQLLFDEILWTTAGDDGDHLLHAQHVPADATEPPEPARPIGSAGQLRGDIVFEPCRTAQAMSVLVRGEPQGYATDVAMVFRSSSGWHEPLHVTVPSDWFGRTCYGEASSLSWIDAQQEAPLEPNAPAGSPIEGQYRVHRIRCTAAACVHAESDVILQRHSRASRYVVGDLGEAMFLLWRSPMGDVRMRVARLRELGAAGEVSLFDDEQHGGFAWELGRGAVFARARVALVVLNAPTATGHALYGLRIDEHGHVWPVDVAAPGSPAPP